MSKEMDLKVREIMANELEAREVLQQLEHEKELNEFLDKRVQEQHAEYKALQQQPRFDRDQKRALEMAINMISAYLNAADREETDPDEFDYIEELKDSHKILVNLYHGSGSNEIK